MVTVVVILILIDKSNFNIKIANFSNYNTIKKVVIHVHAPGITAITISITKYLVLTRDL